jgi:hypothetical protein
MLRRSLESNNALFAKLHFERAGTIAAYCAASESTENIIPFQCVGSKVGL